MSDGWCVGINETIIPPPSRINTCYYRSKTNAIKIMLMVGRPTPIKPFTKPEKVKITRVTITKYIDSITAFSS